MLPFDGTHFKKRIDILAVTCQTNNTEMKSYLRFLSRNKLYTAIMAVGLSVSLAFIIPTVNYFIKYSQSRHQYADYENTWTLTKFRYIRSSIAIGEVLEAEIPAIEKVSTIDMRGQEFKVDDNTVSVFRCDSLFFEYFPIKFVEGDRSFIEVPTHICVSKKYSDILASDGQPVIGREILLGEKSYMIAAVMQDLGDGAISYCDILMNISETKKSRSVNHRVVTVFTGKDTTGLCTQIEKVCTDFYGKEDNYNKAVYDYIVRYDDFRSHDSQLAFNVSPKEVRAILMLISLVLLVISIINYCNLAVSISNLRAKEFATRQLLGSRSVRTYAVLFTEALIFGFLCLLIAIPLSSVTSDMISQFMILTDIDPGNLGFVMSPVFLLAYAGIVVVISLITAIPPAILISKYSPLDVTKGEFRHFSKKTISKIFMTFQMMIVIAVVSITLSMYRTYIVFITEDPNCDIEDVFYLVPKDKNSFPYEAFLSEIQKQPEIISCGLTIGVPLIAMNHAYRNEDVSIPYEYILCDEAAFKLYGFKVTEGNSSNPNGIWVCDQIEEFIEATPEIKEDICTVLGMENFVGKIEKFSAMAGNFEHSEPVVGVTDRAKLLESKCDVVIKTTGDHKTTRDKIEGICAQTIGDTHMDYDQMCRFAGYLGSDVPEHIYGRTRELSYSIGSFSIIAIILVTIGLFAMCMYFTTEQKKQTAIRKVFGSDITREMSRVIKLYIKLTAIANLITIPCFWLYAHGVNMNFIRNPMDLPLICLFSIVFSFIISILAVYIPAYRSASSNPAEVLKKE